VAIMTMTTALLTYTYYVTIYIPTMLLHEPQALKEDVRALMQVRIMVQHQNY
jgi:hypothetical protein